MSEPTFLNNEIRDWLMDCGLFDQLQLADFAAASGYFSISTVAEGEAIFREGDAGRGEPQPLHRRAAARRDEQVRPREDASIRQFAGGPALSREGARHDGRGNDLDSFP